MEIFECMVCCDDVSRATSHFCCPNDDDHTQCIACFAHFVQYTSSQWMTGQAFPLKCPVKECGHEIPEWQIRQILQEVAADVKKIKNVTSDDANNENSNKDDDDGSNEYASVWETYLSAAFKAGFLNDPENVETVCSRCDVFTYLLPANYRERAHFLHTDTWIAEKNSSTIAKLQTQMQERRDAEKERFDIEYLQIRAQEEMQLEHDFSIAMQFTETKEWLLDNMFQEPGSTELTEIPSQLSPEEQNK